MGLAVVVLWGAYAQSKPAASGGQAGATSSVSSGGAAGSAVRTVPGVEGSVATAGTTSSAASKSETSTAAGNSNSQSENISPGPNKPVDESKLLLTDSPASTSSQKIPTFGVWDLVRMVLVLGLVVALIYGVFYLLKKSANGKVVETNSMRVLGSLQMPGNRVLFVVEAGKQVFLLSGGDHTLSLVSEITDQESIDDIRLKAAAAAAGPKKAFSDLLSGMIGSITSQHTRAGMPARGSSSAGVRATSRGAASGGNAAGLATSARAASTAPVADSAGRNNDRAEYPPGEEVSTASLTSQLDFEAQSEDGGGGAPLQFLRQQRERLRRLQ